MFKTELFECICHSHEHIMIVNFDEKEGDFYIETHLSTLPFYNRIWAAIKYLFGYKCQYGCFECWQIKDGDVDKMMDLLKKKKDFDKQKASATNCDILYKDVQVSFSEIPSGGEFRISGKNFVKNSECCASQLSEDLLPISSVMILPSQKCTIKGDAAIYFELINQKIKVYFVSLPIGCSFEYNAGSFVKASGTSADQVEKSTLCNYTKVVQKEKPFSPFSECEITRKQFVELGLDVKFYKE